MIPHATKLIERAHKGEKLTTKERRHCVAYLIGTGDTATNEDLGQLFQVSARMIRIDKKTIREDKAKLLKEDDIALVIVDIAMRCEQQIRDLEKGKAKCDVGSRTYMEYCKSIFNVELQKVKALQDLGYYPKNLGNMTVDKYDYKAIVAKDGTVQVRKEDIDLKLLDAPQEQIMEAEFESAEPAPENTLEDCAPAASP